MWEYFGPSDLTRTHPEEVHAKIKAITPARDNPRGSRLVAPFSLENLTNEAFTQMSSSVPLVDRGPGDVASDTDHPDDSAEAGEYEEPVDGEDDQDDDDEGSEDDDEVKSSRSEDRVPESRSKTHHDSGVHGGGPNGSRTAKPSGSALSTRASKRGRGEIASSPEKTTKQPKISTTKPRKAAFIPKIKMAIPMASTANTSTASPNPQTLEKERADADCNFEGSA